MKLYTILKKHSNFILKEWPKKNIPFPKSLRLETHLQKGGIVLEDDVVIANIHVDLPQELIV